MATDTTPPYQNLAATATLRRVLTQVRDPYIIDDLLFLESWEMRPLPNTAAVLRIKQIRRANPSLAAAIRAEIADKPALQNQRATIHPS